MNLASDEARNGLAQAIGDFFGWLGGGLFRVFTDVGLGLGALGGLLLLFAVWRVSLMFGPEKTCWRCGGKGELGGIIGGKKGCGWCNTTGRRPRVGSGGKK